MTPSRLVFVLSLFALSGCPQGPKVLLPTDTSPTDTSPTDTSPTDTSPTDTSAEDTGEPCPLRGVDFADAIVVAPGGVDSASCGELDAPCQSLATALARTTVTGRSRIYLEEGEHAGPLELRAGLRVEGGFVRDGGTLEPRCDVGAADLATIRAAKDVDTTVTATDLGGTARLAYLTVTSRTAPASAGESLYGIRAVGATTELVLDEVKVATGDAGDGVSGGAAADGLDGVGTCPNGNGTGGGSAADGSHGSGQYSASGYAAGDGQRGDDGIDGSNGTQGSDPGTASCSDITPNGGQCSCGTVAVPIPRGQGGCAGEGGEGGALGTGGGSSVALFVWAATVTTNGGALTSGDGGDGGSGAPGGAGGEGASGSRPVLQCTQDCEDSECPAPSGGSCSSSLTNCLVFDPLTIVGSMGGRGGDGENGGMGGSGAGGDSYAAYVGGAGTLTTNFTATTFGAAGSGGIGAPDGSAAERN